jgi:hypothetical protein
MGRRRIRLGLWVWREAGRREQETAIHLEHIGTAGSLSHPVDCRDEAARLRGL